MNQKKVKAIGGVFFKSENPKEMQDWYDRHLGLSFQQKGYHSFLWKDNESGEQGRTEFSFFKKDTDYMNPSKSPFMINFAVENLEELIIELKSEGIQQVGEIESYPYGKFAWILDPEGNKIELWEPIEKGFETE
jgi:predicted enzyme related to lactoylglutathione lyase